MRQTVGLGIRERSVDEDGVLRERNDAPVVVDCTLFEEDGMVGIERTLLVGLSREIERQHRSHQK